MTSHKQKLIDARRARIPLARVKIDEKRTGAKSGSGLVILAALMVPLVAVSIGALLYMQSTGPAVEAVPVSVPAVSPVGPTAPAADPIQARRIQAIRSDEPKAPANGAVIAVSSGAARSGEPGQLKVGAIAVATDDAASEAGRIPASPGPLPVSSSQPIDCVERAAELAARTTIWFPMKSPQVSRAQHEVLTLLADALSQCPAARLEVGGHADDAADAKLNAQLSLDRARGVSDMLQSRGVAATQIEPIAYGASRRLAKSKRPDDSQLNRRVDLVVR